MSTERKNKAEKAITVAPETTRAWNFHVSIVKKLLDQPTVDPNTQILVEKGYAKLLDEIKKYAPHDKLETPTSEIAEKFKEYFESCLTDEFPTERVEVRNKTMFRIKKNNPLSTKLLPNQIIYLFGHYGLADGITVSTAVMGRTLRAFNPNVSGLRRMEADPIIQKLLKADIPKPIDPEFVSEPPPHPDVL